MDGDGSKLLESKKLEAIKNRAHSKCFLKTYNAIFEANYQQFKNLRTHVEFQQMW